MISNDKKITKSIPSVCFNYKPAKELPTNIACQKLGFLYECENHIGKEKGCVFCQNFKQKNSNNAN